MDMARRAATALVMAVAAVSAGCFTWAPTEPTGVEARLVDEDGRPQRAENPLHMIPKWETPWLVSAGGGVLVPFHNDVKDGSGYYVQAGYGRFVGLGARYMDFSFRDKAGDRIDTETYLGYFGIGTGSFGRKVPVGHYLGIGLGTTKVDREDVGDDTKLAGMIAAGFSTYKDIKSGEELKAGVGLNTELGLFYSDAVHRDISGATLMLGFYFYF